MGNAAWIEIAWSVMAIACGAGNARIWWEAMADYRYVQAREYPQSRELVGFDLVMTASFLLAVQVIFFLIGLIAMSQPAQNPETTMTTVGAFVAGGLMLVEVLLLVLAIWSRRNWRRVVRVIERERLEADDA